MDPSWLLIGALLLLALVLALGWWWTARRWSRASRGRVRRAQVGEHRAEALLEGLAAEPVAGRRFLMPRALAARDVLPETLRRQGAEVTIAPAYQTVLPHSRTEQVLELLERRQLDCVTFTSSSTVTNFFQLFPPEQVLPRLASASLAAIGPVTAETLARFGLEATIMPSHYTIEALVESICDHFAGDPR